MCRHAAFAGGLAWLGFAPVALLMLTLTIGVQAQPVQDTPAPEESLLLFLADWDDARGGWQDPLEFDGPGWPDTEQRQVNDDHAMHDVSP